MKVITSVSLFIMFIFSSSVFAVEPIEEQQALLYYQIPFGGVKKADNAHKFGFRVDRVSIDSTTGQYSDSVTFNDMMKKPAALDFQIGYKGMTAVKMHGYDYLPHIVSKVDEESGENGGADGQENVEAKDGEAGESKEGEKKKLLKYSEVLDQTTVGLMIGAAILIGMIAL